MAVSEQDVIAGQAAYTRLTLALYDALVLGFSNRFVWRCPTARILGLYDRHAGGDHLDVGVGTGFYLDRCRFPSAQPRLVLLDLNPACLDTAARRVRRYRPTVHRADVLQPVSIEPAAFASIGLTYVLHCLPGTMETKTVCFEHLARLLAPGGILFGATLLGPDVPHTATARRLMAVYNAKKIFCNSEDDLAGLRRALSGTFAEHGCELVGSAALFWGRR